MTSPSTDPNDLPTPTDRSLTRPRRRKAPTWESLRDHLVPLVEEEGGVSALARKAGMTPARLEKLLTHENPSVKDLIQVLEALGMSLYEFFWSAELMGVAEATDSD